MAGLSDEIQTLKGIGKKRAEAFGKLGLWQAEDLLYYLPFRYEDRSEIADITRLSNGDNALIFGTIAQVRNVRLPAKKMLLRVTVRTDSGNITLIWFNQPYIAPKMNIGELIMAYGKYHCKNEKQLAVQDYHLPESAEEITKYMGIMPVYPASETLSAAMLKKTIEQALEIYLPFVQEYLPEEWLKEYHLAPLQQALYALHRPNSWESLNIARYRLVLDEFLLLLLSLAVWQNKDKVPGRALRAEETLTRKFLELLPFTPTDAQKKVIMEIKRDMESPYAMHRLLQGDVGSGKTIVAIYALLKAVENGAQAVLMVPTEILAEQHYLTTKRYLEPLGVKIALLSGGVAKKEMRELKEQIANGEISVVIGTHALIEDDVEFQKLALAVIDEQHRFGVRQQQKLYQKGQTADVLVMTATPIPRSLALTIYGDLDLSVIDQLPQGRKEIITWAIGEKKRKGMYKFLRERMNAGEQAYIVCPLVKVSEKMDLSDAEETAQKLQTEIFPDKNIAVLHGQMKNEDKAEIMENFRLGKIDILVATTVIEVGVDVPNATVMIIENAERFGLAQLHQLRGRIGRGEKQGYCILMGHPNTEESKRRLEVMTKTNDGFFIAEEDLSIRGPGEVLGLRQHGLPELKVADLTQDIAELELAKKLADEILADGIENEKYAELRAKLKRRLLSAKLTLEVERNDG